MLPTLEDFGDSVFVANHCFTNSGVEMLGRDSVLRVDFSPADRIRSIDIAGSVFLELPDVEIRRSEFHLSKQPPGSTGITATAVAATYRDALPFVPVLDSVTAVSLLRPEGDDRIARREIHRLLEMVFLEGTPGATTRDRAGPATHAHAAAAAAARER